MGLTPEYKSQAPGPQSPGEDATVTKRNSQISAPADSTPQLIGILSRVSGLDPQLIKPNSRLIEDIGIDSLGYYEILIEAQEHLDIKIQEVDMLSFQTVEDIDNHLRKLKRLDDQTN